MLDTATHNNRRSRQRLNGTARGHCTSRLPIAPAACERRALDGVAVFCVAMKCDGVKRLRHRRETSVLQRRSRWRLYAFGALPDYPCTSRQRTASPWRGSFREGRSGEVAAGTEGTHLERSGSRGRVHRLLRSARCQCDSEGAGLALYPASAVTERSIKRCSNPGLGVTMGVTACTLIASIKHSCGFWRCIR